MIYIWHNPLSQRYELGNEDTFEVQKTQYDVYSLYDFLETETVIAQKILTNLNRAARVS